MLAIQVSIFMTFNIGTVVMLFGEDVSSVYTTQLLKFLVYVLLIKLASLPGNATKNFTALAALLK